MTTEFEATARESGTEATRKFADRHRGTVVGPRVPPERVSRMAREVLEGVRDVIYRHNMTYAEYEAVKAWLIQLGEDGEVPLFLDVWVEHWVEDSVNSSREGSEGSIEGPYYVPGAPDLGAVGTLPMREQEAGVPMVWSGYVRSTDGTALAGTVELWHADAFGFYSQFAPSLPEWNLRGTFTTGDDGRFEITTVQPAPYQIPTDGACGKLVAAAGWHAWRPAHLHVKVSAPGHQQLTAQLYFPGDPHNDDDIAQAVKPELILEPRDDGRGGTTVNYDFVLAPAADPGNAGAHGQGAAD